MRGFLGQTRGPVSPTAGENEVRQFFYRFAKLCGIIYTAWTTNDLATTRPRTGVVSYRTGRAGALSYLKYTPAPPEFPQSKWTKEAGGIGSLPDIVVLSARCRCVIYEGRFGLPGARDTLDW